VLQGFCGKRMPLQKLCGFDSSDGICDQLAKLLALFDADCGAQILDLDQPLTHEHDLGHFGDVCHPGITNQLGIRSQQPRQVLPNSERRSSSTLAGNVSFVPGTIQGDAESVLLVVNGSGFVPQSRIMWTEAHCQPRSWIHATFRPRLLRRSLTHLATPAGSIVQISVRSLESVADLGCPYRRKRSHPGVSRTRLSSASTVTG
jgi:hypothetical protein